MNKKESKLKQKICYKCKKKPEYFFRNELYMCYNCFYEVMNKKFRSFLKSKMQIQGKNLKVYSYFDGSLNSLVLNDLYKSKVEYFINPKNPLKEYVDFSILFVSFFALEKILAITEDQLKQIEQKQKLLKEFQEFIQIKFCILNVEDYYILEEIKEQLLQTKSLGGFKLDYLLIIRDKIIKQYLRQQNATHFLTGENSEQLGARCLKLMCKSRNIELIQQCSPMTNIDNGDKNIKHGRPLNEFMYKDIYYFIYKKDYTKFSFDQFDFLNSFYTNKEMKLPGNGSIDNVLTEFVQTLQDRYHSTTNTILKTVVKVQDQQLNKQGKLCELCERVYLENDTLCKGCKVIKQLTL